MLTAAALVAFAVPAIAAEKIVQMPIDFIGDWCDVGTVEYPNEYRLPSWMHDEPCKNILSVGKLGFSYNERDLSCEAVVVKTTKDTAPSGTAYMATIKARCYTQAQPNGTIRTFEVSRYKGNMTFAQK